MEHIEPVILVEKLSYLQIEICFAVLFPIITACIWKFRKKAEWIPMITGVCSYFAFAIIGRQIMNLLFLGISETVASFISGSLGMSVTYAVLQAVFLEETARYISFKMVLSDDMKKQVPVSFGIGFGGLECMYILGFTALDHLILAMQINTVGIEKIVEMVGAKDTQIFDVFVKEINKIQISDILLVSYERIAYMIIQVSLSVLIFIALRNKEKIRLFLLAVIVHIALELFIHLFSGQLGYGESRIAMESFLLMVALGLGYFAYRSYKNIPETPIVIRKHI